MSKSLQGFSLIETMVSLALAMFILTVLTQQYLSIKQQNIQLQKTIADQAELQWVGDLIRSSIRNAGFTPCGNIDHLISVDQTGKNPHLSSIDIQPQQLSIRRMSDHVIEGHRQLNANTLLMQAKPKLNKQDLILIADCFHAEIHSVKDHIVYANEQKVILDNALAFEYQNPFYVGEWIQESYFIRPTSLGKQGLFYRRQHSEELTPLVTSISISEHPTSKRTLVEVILNNPTALNIITQKIIAMVRSP
jgi:type II secretory pathway component PulJ